MFLAWFHSKPLLELVLAALDLWLHSSLFQAFLHYWPAIVICFWVIGVRWPYSIPQNSTLCSKSHSLVTKSLPLQYLSLSQFQKSNKGKKSTFCTTTWLVLQDLSKPSFFSINTRIYASNSVASFALAFMLSEIFKFKVRRSLHFFAIFWGICVPDFLCQTFFE